MQFLWKYIDDLVGKGLDIAVIGELFFYAALTMVPLALPLSILLASLMVFGNLGEHFELTAMKSSGVSLLKVMSPLIILISFVSVGAFFFQNDVLPKAQVKMWTLLFSMRQKSPELDIPEGAFYDQIQGYNLFVKEKNRQTGMLYNMMIYDVSKGYGYANIIVADSGKLSFTEDKKHLFLQLYQGESFEDLGSDRSMGAIGNTSGALYRRESFNDKEIMIPFDATFNRMDDQTMRSQYIGKNLTELQHTIDSVGLRVDSVGNTIADQLKNDVVCGVPVQRYLYKDGKMKAEKVKGISLKQPLNIDSLIKVSSVQQQQNCIESALSHATRIKQDYEFKGYSMQDDQTTIRRHKIEMQKKFTLSFACLIFFFIGAPLGAIIRKGGLGAPIVISVFLFIVYYIFDNFGYKLARDGRWDVWKGMWLSSSILLPLGVFFTYKAVNDSAVFNPDSYINFFKRITGQHQVRHLELKEVVMDDVVPADAMAKINEVKSECEQFLAKYSKKQSYIDYWRSGYDKTTLRHIAKSIDDLVDYLGNSRSQLVINKVMDYPIIRQLLSYHPTNYSSVGMVVAIIFPIGLLGYFVGTRHQKVLKRDIASAVNVSDELLAIFKEDSGESEN